MAKKELWYSVFFAADGKEEDDFITVMFREPTEKEQQEDAQAHGFIYAG